MRSLVCDTISYLVRSLLAKLPMVIDLAPTPLARVVDSAQPAPRPALLRAAILRFGLVYSALYFLPIVTGFVIGLQWLGDGYDAVRRPLIGWVARDVLGISYDLTWRSGSGDKTVDWIWILCCAVTALIATVVWLLVDRRRARDARIRAVLRVMVRYCLAFIMLRYGVSKLFILQFPAPSSTQLLQEYGASSPMSLLWTFMGASPAYVFFSGAAETIGALLLLFRRTTTLGALVLGVVLVNVVMMNLCYDVPVKGHSSHYLVMCGFLILPDVRSLVNLLVLRRPAQPVVDELALPERWMRVARRVLKYGAICYLVGAAFYVDATRKFSHESSAWYEGYWNVTAFTRDGQDVPAIITDATRWRRLRFQSQGPDHFLRWRFMDGTYGDLYRFAIDDQARTITLTPETDAGTTAAGGAHEPARTVVLRYIRSDADHLELTGVVGATTIAVKLEHFAVDHAPLMTRGFHWINEVPFTR